MPALKSPNGQVVWVSDDQMTHALDTGYTPVSSEEASEQTTAPEKRGGGVLGGAVAGATSFASGATLGLSDLALKGVLSKGDTDYVRQARENHAIVSGVGNVAGALAPALVAPESLLARNPAGYLARAASGATESARAIGGLKGAAAVAGISGLEGAAQSGGMYLSDVALGDRDLTVEGAAGALGSGFAFGSVAGGATLGIEKGTMAARRMFARVAEGGEQAATDAAATFDRKAEEVLTAHDDTAAIARKRLDEIRQAKAEAARTKMQANAELAQSKLEASQPAQAFEPEPVTPMEPAPTGTAPRAMPETAGPAGETQVSQTSSAKPEAPTAARTSLEDQLAATKRRLDEGASLSEINTERDLGKPIADEEQKLDSALATYADRRAKVDAWIKRIKNPRTALETETTAADIGAGRAPAIRGRTTRALDEDVFVEQSGGNLRTIGKGEHTLEDITPNSRILARSNGESFSQGSKLDEAYQDAIERGKLAETAAERDAALHEAADIEQQIHKYVRDTKPENAAVIDQIERVRAAAGRTGYHAAFARAERAAMDDASAVVGKLGKVDPAAEADYQAALASKGPKGPVDLSFLDQAREQGFLQRAQGIAEERAKRGLPALSDEEMRAIVRPSAPLPPSYGKLNIVEQAHEAATVLGDYEKAAADLTEAVGDAAPPAAKDAADGYRKAESNADRKAMDRTTRAIDDHVQYGPAAPEQLGPFEQYRPMERNPAERAASAKQVKIEADARLQKLKVEEAGLRDTLPARGSKLKKEVESPPAQPAAAAEQPKGRFQRAMHVADKVGQGLELASMAGIPGIPSPHDIPVVGPLLGMYLKWKALSSKLLGRVPATADAKMAALAARTRDRAAHSVDRMLGLVEKAAPTARTVSVATSARVGEILSKRIFDDGHPNAPKDASPTEMAAVRVREIAAAATNPDAIVAQVRQQMRGVTDPDLIAAAEQHQIQKIQYLNANAPKEPPPSPLVKRQWTPTPAEANRFARRVEVADNPVAALEQVEKGTITPEAADTLRACYPKLFGEVQQRLVERSADVKTSVPYQQRLKMSLLFNVPLDPTLQPETIGVLQSVHALASKSPAAPAQSQPPMPSVAGPVDLGKLYDPTAHRVARR